MYIHRYRRDNNMDNNSQVSALPTNTKVNQSEWKTIGVKVYYTELPLLNKQLDRLNYATLEELVKDFMSSKITHLTDDQQIEITKTILQTNGQITGFSGKPYDFYKQIDITDLQKYLEERYHEHTAACYLSYFEKYANVLPFIFSQL
jgi:hypothetical protein